LGRSLYDSTDLDSGTEGIGAQRFDGVSKIWMDLLFDVRDYKSVFFLPIFTPDSSPYLKYRKIIILFTIIPYSRTKTIWQIIFL
jgi:hypothetical protein